MLEAAKVQLVLLVAPNGCSKESLTYEVKPSKSSVGKAFNDIFETSY